MLHGVFEEFSNIYIKKVSGTLDFRSWVPVSGTVDFRSWVPVSGTVDTAFFISNTFISNTASDLAKK